MKRLLTLTMICALLGVTAPAWGTTAEQPSPWAAEAIARLKAWGRIDAADFTRYQSPMTRKEFSELAVAVYEALAGEPTEGISDELKHAFKDTEDYSVLQAWQLGIVSGDGTGYFKPDASITREQMAKMIVQLAEKSGKPLQLGNSKIPIFKDQSHVSGWAQTSVKICISQGILNDVGNNSLSPQGAVTREQAFGMIAALVELKSTLNP